jgi:hypothetical protein
MEAQQVNGSTKRTPKLSRKVKAEARLAYHDARLNVEQIAGLLQVSSQWVRRLTNEGVFSKVDGRYRLIETVQAYLRYVRDEQRRTGKAETQNQLMRARAAEIELRTRLREKTLIETDDAINTLDEIIGMMLTEFGDLPGRTRDLTARRIIEQAVREMRGRLADKIRAKVKELAA